MITDSNLAYANEAYILRQAIHHIKFKRTKLDPARAMIYKMIIEDLEKDMKEMLEKVNEQYVPSPSLEGGVNVNSNS